MAILAILGLSQPAQATIITFDQTITPGANATVNSDIPGLIVEYHTPSQQGMPAPNPDTFLTQGFTFGGYTPPVTQSRTAPELIIMLNALQCPTLIGTSCAHDASNSHFLIDGGEAFSMFIGGSNFFSLSGFDATGLFPPAGCPLFIDGVQPGCDDQEVILPALFLKVVGVGAGNVVLGSQTFALTSAFASMVITNPGFTSIQKAIFLPVDAQGNLAGRIMAIDNINVAAVPEPASLLLLGTGLVAVVRHRKRKS